MTETFVAKLVFESLFLLIVVGVFLQPSRVVFQGAPSQSRWRDLRYWALFLVVIHAVVYAYL